MKLSSQSKQNNTPKIFTNWNSKGLVFSNCSKCGILRVISKELVEPDPARYKSINLPNSTLCLKCK